MAHARSGRETAKAIAAANRPIAPGSNAQGALTPESVDDMAAIAPPPGQDDVQYASLSGN